MFIHITDVEYAGKYKLRLTFDDGATKVVDLEDELDGPVFEPLRNLKLFSQVAVNRDTGTIEWPNGADFAPEFLREMGEVTGSVQARKAAEEHGVYGRNTPK